jgi:hypothetical protein
LWPWRSGVQVPSLTPSGRVVCGARGPRTLPARASASSSTAEQWTLNPLVLGSNPRGRTSSRPVSRCGEQPAETNGVTNEHPAGVLMGRGARQRARGTSAGAASEPPARAARSHACFTAAGLAIRGSTAGAQPLHGSANTCRRGDLHHQPTQLMTPDPGRCLEPLLPHPLFPADVLDVALVAAAEATDSMQYAGGGPKAELIERLPCPSSSGPASDDDVAGLVAPQDRRRVRVQSEPSATARSTGLGHGSLEHVGVSAVATCARGHKTELNGTTPECPPHAGRRIR